jgi:hypothetical protein
LSLLGALGISAPMDDFIFPMHDIARLGTIGHDTRPNPHDTSAISHDPPTKTRESAPKLNDERYECLK